MMGLALTLTGVVFEVNASSVGVSYSGWEEYILVNNNRVSILCAITIIICVWILVLISDGNKWGTFAAFQLI